MVAASSQSRVNSRELLFPHCPVRPLMRLCLSNGLTTKEVFSQPWRVYNSVQFEKSWMEGRGMSVKDTMLLLFSAATWGGWAFLTKIGSTELSATTTQVMSWSGSALVVLTLCTKGFEFRYTPPHFAVIVAGILVALGNLSYFKAARHVPVSIAYPIVALHVLVPVILGVLLLGEKLSPQKGLGIVCALIAVLLLIRS